VIIRFLRLPPFLASLGQVEHLLPMDSVGHEGGIRGARTWQMRTAFKTANKARAIHLQKLRNVEPPHARSYLEGCARRSFV
jgi:hypothetical protein